MKRNLLAIAIPALLVAGTANASVEIWNQNGNKINVAGRVKAVDVLTKKGNDKGDHSEARFGFEGESQITDSLTGYGRASWQTSSKRDNSMGVWKLETRYAFAGLNFGDFGSFDYGRNDGLVKGISAYTDILPEFGGDSSNQNYYLLANRNSGLATYRNSNLFGLVDGFSFALQYAERLNKIDPESGDVLDYDKFNREALAASFDYAILDSGLSLAGAYARTAGDDYNSTWATGLKYDANNILLAATYFQSKDKRDLALDTINATAKRYWGVEVVAQYAIDFEVGRLIPSVAYIQHKQKDIDSGNIVKYVDVGATYRFNQNLAAIVDYKINLLREEDKGVQITTGTPFNAKTKNSVGVGLIYQF